MRFSLCTLAAGLTAVMLAGCRSPADCCEPTANSEMTAPAVTAPTTPAATPAPAAAPAPAAMPAPAKPAVAPTTALTSPIRIKAGLSTPLTDAEGNVWLADQGFTDGDTIERPGLSITNTTTPAIYQSERYSMTAFSRPVPNGKYTVKLHFAETFEGVGGPGGRIFSFNVEGKEFKDFDVWAKAGGQQRAYIETVAVEVTDGKLDISFTPNVENPEINGIEILPGS
jgi:endoglucanase